MKVARKVLSRGIKITVVISGNQMTERLTPRLVYRLCSSTIHVHTLPHLRPSLLETSIGGSVFHS